MSKRKQQHADITERAWDYLNDCAEDDRPHGFVADALPATGLDTTRSAALGVGLLLLAAILLIATRRRRDDAA